MSPSKSRARRERILRSEFDRPKQISYKGEVDIVTESDRRSEALIVARLRKHFPDHGIIAEEGGTGAAAGAKYCWHVDPLDGTTNFAHGYPCFAVSIGLAEEGRPIAGVVFNPVSDEMFTAARGEGAFLNGKRDSRLAHRKAGLQPGGHGLPHAPSQAEREHQLLLGVHAALARSAARRFGRARSLLGGVRPLRGVLGIRPEFVGYRRGSTARRGGRRTGH